MTHIVNTKVTQGLGNLDLLLGVEEGVCKLLTLTQSTLNNLETRHIAQEVGHGRIVAVGIPSNGRMRVLPGLDGSITRVRRRILIWQMVNINQDSVISGLKEEFLLMPLTVSEVPLGPLFILGDIVGGMRGQEGLKRKRKKKSVPRPGCYLEARPINDNGDDERRCRRR